MAVNLQQIGQAVGQALSDFGATTANAARTANNVSRQAQSAQAAFNAEAMNQANAITDNRLSAQYGFNSAMMANANNFTQQSWENAAAWNEKMWQKQADFNAEQAQIQRDWQERMSNTQYQRAMQDMQKAGLNPILAYSQGGAGVPNGAAATVGGAQMSSAQSQMASGGLLGAESASINNYSGQMETLTGMLGLLTAICAGASSAQNAYTILVDGIEESLPEENKTENKQIRNTVEKMANGTADIGDVLDLTLNHRPGSSVMRTLAGLLPDSWNPWKDESSKKK